MKAGDKTKRIANYCQLGVIFSGSQDEDTVTQFPMLAAPLKMEIMRLREAALDKLLNSPELSLPKEIIEFSETERKKERQILDEQRKKLLASNVALQQQIYSLTHPPTRTATPSQTSTSQRVGLIQTGLRQLRNSRRVMVSDAVGGCWFHI